MAAEVVMYSTHLCGFCLRARQLLEQKGVAFDDIRVDANPVRRDEMLARSGGRHTVPQIFIGGRHVGGCQELYELEHGGRLDELLGGDGH